MARHSNTYQEKIFPSPFKLDFNSGNVVHSSRGSKEGGRILGIPSEEVKTHVSLPANTRSFFAMHQKNTSAGIVANLPYLGSLENTQKSLPLSCDLKSHPLSSEQKLSTRSPRSFKRVSDLAPKHSFSKFLNDPKSFSYSSSKYVDPQMSFVLYEKESPSHSRVSAPSYNSVSSSLPSGSLRPIRDCSPHANHSFYGKKTLQIISDDSEGSLKEVRQYSANNVNHHPSPLLIPSSQVTSAVSPVSPNSSQYSSHAILFQDEKKEGASVGLVMFV
jgi:hypothetical protein